MKREAKPKLVRVTTIAASLDKLLEHQLAFMQQYFEVVAVASDDPVLQRVGAKEGVRTKGINLTRKITPLQDLKSLWRMYRFFRSEKPEVVHTHTPKAGTVGMLAAWLARVPIRLHTIAGLPLLEATGKKRTLLNWVERMTCFFATRVYPNSFGLKEIMERERLCPPKKMAVIGKGSSNGINTGYFSMEHFPAQTQQQLRERLGIGEAFVFVFVGRLVKDKGINELVAAFKQVSHRQAQVRLLLVGNYEQELDPLLPETLQDIEKHPGIVAVGFQQDVRPYLAIADALVFPSYREGFPNVVMQACAMGLPAIVSDINGCNEIVQEGYNGLIVPVKSSSALEDAMLQLLENNGLYLHLQSNCRSSIVKHYQREVVWQALLQEYRRLMHNADGGAPAGGISRL